MIARNVKSVRVASVALFALLSLNSAAFAQSQAERGGFTILGNIGFGFQHDSVLEESATGLGGVNLGVGGFLTENLALTFRFSGTNVTYDFDIFELRQVSGVAGPTLQYWPSDRFNVEAGLGYGFWNTEFNDDTGFGTILGAAVTIFNKGKHNLQIGVEYAPAFTGDGTVHNIGVTFGYQFL